MRSLLRPDIIKNPFIMVGFGSILVLVLALVFSGVMKMSFDSQKFGSADYGITYCRLEGEYLRMDLFYPSSGGPWPVLLFVHGGGWTEGDKAGVWTDPVNAGYLVVSINYRMAPDYLFPAMIQDVKCAIRYLKAHAKTYNLDPQRIALIGHSAGAHLVALAGLADERAGWDVGPFQEQSSRVQAVIPISGPYDLDVRFSPDIEMLIQNAFGSDQRSIASPVKYADPKDPPFLIIHGDEDSVVPVEQATLLQEALLKEGVPVELVVVKNAGHGLEPITGEIFPSSSQIFQQAILFLTQSLALP